MLYDVSINYDVDMNYAIGEYSLYYSNYFFESDSSRNIHVYDKEMNHLDIIYNSQIEDYNDFKVECYSWIHRYKKTSHI